MGYWSHILIAVLMVDYESKRKILPFKCLVYLPIHKLFNGKMSKLWFSCENLIEQNNLIRYHIFEFQEIVHTFFGFWVSYISQVLMSQSGLEEELRQ